MRLASLMHGDCGGRSDGHIDVPGFCSVGHKCKKLLGIEVACYFVLREIARPRSLVCGGNSLPVVYPVLKNYWRFEKYNQLLT